MMHNAPQSEMTKVINRGEAMMDYKGRVLRPSYKAVVRSPAAAGTLAFEKAAMVELATRYDLDGVQFDYIRYPVYSADYSPAARRRFEADTGQKVKSWPWQVWKGSLAGEYGRWKIDVITQLVGEVSAAVRDASDVKISAAVWSNPTVGRDEYGQDWPSWVRKGYLDFVCPMSYTKVDSNLRKWTGMQIAAVDGRVPIYPGLGAYMLKTPSQLNSQINIVRQAGLPGYVLYNADNRTLHEFLPHIKN
jgi:uncharacterized lipoprotein YddW (UPF0748 family)